MVWLNLGEILKVHAAKYPGKTAVKDWRGKSWTYAELDSRTDRLANGLLGMGLQKGDRVAVLLHNCVEFVEVACAFAKTGLVVTPVSWRYVGSEMEYVVKHSGAKAIIVGDEFIDVVNQVRSSCGIKGRRCLVVGENVPEDYVSYERVVCESEASKVKAGVESKDTWFQIYTSGTTGAPKGVVRSHESYIAFYLINAVEFGFSEADYGMIVMPLYHVNSTFYGLLFLYLGASLFVGRDERFNPVELLQTISEEGITFTSLIPTHYNLILNVPRGVREGLDVSSVKKLLCSSAPVRSKVKKGILNCFPSVELYEAYGSTEAGLVTILKPGDQLRKLGSMGRESIGTDLIKVLNGEGGEVGVGEVGELYSRGPMVFDEYYDDPAKTAKAFAGDFFTARDLVKKDEEGYYYIVDRKDNMIITGGEHVYPSEVEEVISQHHKVFDVAVIGVPDEKWGESVKAVVILKKGETGDEKEIIEWCRGKIAGYKKPKSVDFVEEMPRTATGKILHRRLKEMYAEKVDL